jgi:tyrosinase
VTTNLGPLGLNSVNITTPNPRADGFGYNPRCIRRDLNVAAALGTSDYNATKLVRDSSDIIAFQHNLEGPFNYPGLGLELGVHTAGHYILGGDPGGDFFTSPGDPYFYFHHAQIDRIYWMWQNRGLPERYGQITGTRTILNQPPSPNATLDDTLDLGVLDAFGTKTPSGKPVTLRELMSTTDGPFCYIYE